MTEQHPNEDLHEEAIQTPEGQTEEKKLESEEMVKLRNEFTQTRQREINASIKLAEADKRTILDLDPETQKKVVKHIYWYNSIEEVKHILWDKFYETKEDEVDEEEDRYASLEKRLKLSEYQQGQKELDREIEGIKAKNPLAFENPEVEQKLRDELKFISTELSLDERVKRAASLVVGNTDDLWRSLKQEGWYSPAKKAGVEDAQEKLTSKDEVNSIFERRFPNKNK
jgi:hypothetical protein